MRLERLGREERADAAGAVEHDGRVAVGRRALDLLLDVAPGDVGGAGDVALLPLASARARRRAGRRADSSSSASAGPTSRTAARASRSRSDRYVSWSGALQWSWRGPSAMSRQDRRLAGREAGQSGRVQSPWSCPDPGCGSRWRSRARKRALQRVQREQRALQARRADLDAQQVEDVLAWPGCRPRPGSGPGSRR